MYSDMTDIPSLVFAASLMSKPFASLTDARQA